MRRDLTVALAAAALALAVLAVAWSGLYSGVSGGRIALVCALAALPALAARARRHRPALIAAALAAATLAILALAARASVVDLLALDGAAWEEIGRIVPDGLAAGSDSGLPVAPDRRPELVALLDVALALLAGAAAWQIVARGRAVAGVVVVGVGLAYRWTVEPPASDARAGAVALLALVGVLALAGAGRGVARPARRVAGAAALAAVTVGAAVAVGSGPARAGDAWWAWRDWELGGVASADERGLDLTQGYGALEFAAEPRLALTVQASRARPIRAVGLEGFDGIAFTLVEGRPSAGVSADNGTLELGRPQVAGADAVQRIRLDGISSPVVLASGNPVSLGGPFAGRADLVAGAIRLQEPLERGDEYVVRTRIPQPRPADLTGARPYDVTEVPDGSTVLRAYPWSAPVYTPMWGNDAAPPSDARLGPYARVRDLAREVVGDAATPYAAVNRVEAYLRRTYLYDEQPPFPTSLPEDWPPGDPPGNPPLVDFLFTSQRGFCQHFAGAMGVMLRSVGIPARVAVGYTGGRYDSRSGRWQVTDRDAHSWVEVWFPDHGWLAFDPTPGRSAANPASVSSPDYAPTTSEIDLGGIAEAAVAPPGADPSDPAPSSPTTPAPDDPTAGIARGGGGPGALEWIAAGAVLALAGLAAAAGVRRLRARRSGGERERVLAAVREMERVLGGGGLAPAAAAAPSERAATLRARTGADASGLYARAAAARFARGAPDPGAAAWAWRERARLLRAVRRGVPWRRRLRGAALGLAVAPRRRRATVSP